VLFFYAGLGDANTGQFGGATGNTFARIMMSRRTSKPPDINEPKLILYKETKSY
jgi:hypothetical protein